MSELYFDFAPRRIEETLLSEAAFAALDFETTGLYPGIHRIIEIGSVKFNLKGEIDRYTTLVSPGVPIPAEAAGIHGINDSMVAGYPGLDKLLPELLSFLEGTVIIAHNIGFDISFLDAALSENNMPGITNPGIDTRNLAKKVLAGITGFGLERLKHLLNLSPGNSHRALDDAVTCKELFCHLLPKVSGWTDMTVGEMAKYSNTKLR